jgi:predicted Zn-dependent peptidase
MVSAVTLDQVKQAAKRLFDPSRLTVVVAGSYSNSQPGGVRRGSSGGDGRASSLH